VEAEVRAVKDRIAAAQQRQAAYAHAEGVAQSQVQADVTALREEFGIESMGQAESMLAQYRKDLAEELEKAGEALRRAEEGI
jgi:hypothetical protein